MGRKQNSDGNSTPSPGERQPAASRSQGRRTKTRGAVGDRTGAAQSPWVTLAICAGLLLVTFLAFRPALDRQFEFVNLDDNRYVYDNEHVSQGWTPKSVAWALTSFEYDNWHPLTWLSHILDVQIYGLQQAWGHHLTSILFHAASVAVVFLALRLMTAAVWPSLLATALFAIHPLRVESVAWVSERKDVLSGLFFALTLLAYAGYVRGVRPRLGYGLVIVCFALGLMSKPMLVTLPVLLLLLDYWPLGRVAQSRDPEFTRVLLEKVPLLLMSLASCAVTLVAQQGAMKVIDTITLPVRLQNVLLSYAAYIGQFFFPVHLSPIYPFPERGIPPWEVVLAGVVLATITTAVVWLRTWRWLTVGWVWYVVALLPVIGLIQVGVQARADRYTYLPHVGLAIALAWTLDKVTSRWPLRNFVWTVGMLILVPALIQATSAQTRNWRDSETLWVSALKANPECALANNNLGYVYQSKGRMNEAFECYRRAAEIRPRYVEAHINLGNMHMFRKEYGTALSHYRTAIDIRPDFEQSYVNLGWGLMVCGDLPGAEKNLRTALELDPAYVDAHAKLGHVLCQANRLDDGLAELRRAIELAPHFYPAWESMGKALTNHGRHDEAIPCYVKLLEQPSTVLDSLRTLGYLHYVKRRPHDAANYWKAYLDRVPDSLPVLTMMAWMLATDLDPAVRNGSQALALAQRAEKLVKSPDPRVLAALAAAFAEQGDRERAVAALERAKDLPGGTWSETGRQALLQVYQAGQRYYDDKATMIMLPEDPAGR